MALFLPRLLHVGCTALNDTGSINTKEGVTNMRRTTTRKLLIPALLAVAIAPMSLAALAAPGKSDGTWHEQRQEQREERRQALYERAGIDAETRSALEEARTEHQQALRELREQYHERMGE